VGNPREREKERERERERERSKMTSVGRNEKGVDELVMVDVKSSDPGKPEQTRKSGS